MIRKLLTSAAVVSLAAGAAQALELESKVGAANQPTPLAAQLDFAGGDVDGEVFVGIAPTTGLLPADNLVFFVTVSGAEFTRQVVGADLFESSDNDPANATADLDAVISTGGSKGSSSVSFSVDGADNCGEEPTVSTAPATDDANCFLRLPLELDGSDVTVTVGIETDAGVPIDQTSSTAPESIGLYTVADAFDIDIVADMTATTADLNAAGGPFTGFLTADKALGTVLVRPNQVMLGGAAVTVAVDTDGTPVAPGDVDAGDDGEVRIVVEGNLVAFEDGNTPAGDVDLNTTGFTTVSSATGSATSINQLAVQATGSTAGAANTVNVDEDGATAIQASDYTATVTVTPDDSSNLETAQTASGALQSINRNGTNITFPWTQSATQGAASGTISVFRIGNLSGTTASGEVFVEVKNSSEAGYMNPGIQSVAASIAPGGEFVINSATLESTLGNYGRGDIEFTVEANANTLTGRQFVVRGDVIQQVQGGTIFQDLN